MAPRSVDQRFLSHLLLHTLYLRACAAGAAKVRDGQHCGDSWRRFLHVGPRRNHDGLLNDRPTDPAFSRSSLPCHHRRTQFRPRPPTAPRHGRDVLLGRSPRWRPPMGVDEPVYFNSNYTQRQVDPPISLHIFALTGCVYAVVTVFFAVLLLQGIKDPLREDVQYAVAQCQVAGIMVRMVTGDNIATAKVRRTPAGVVFVFVFCLCVCSCCVVLCISSIINDRHTPQPMSWVQTSERAGRK